MSGHVENYQGSDYEGLAPIVMKIYNDTGGAIAIGDVYFLDHQRDADSLSPAARPTVVACATTAIYREVVVALEVIADGAYGMFMKRGFCPTVKCATGVDIDDYLQGVNASQTSGDDGDTQTTDSFGIATTDESVVTGFCAAYLFGTPVLIG